ncbi:hypothetical protein IB030_001839, partial [Campylobacter jejuni]|nr:hypothetical protein [Campylobacter jejuni]
QGGATVETFNNQGIIGNGTSNFGVVIWGSDSSKSTINNFNNSGTIHSNNGESIYLGNANVSTFNNSGTIKSNNREGINIGTGVTIQTIDNSGLIQGNDIGINIANGTTIDNFTNSGLIHSSGNYGSLYLNRATVKTITNNGTIINNGTLQPSTNVDVSSGTFLIYSTIENFTNTGLISGITGVKLPRTTINTFTNKGTIESTGDSTLAAAISLSTIRESPSTIENLINEGLIKSKSNGIIAEAGNYINTLINKGTIEANLNGITFYDHGSVSGSTMKLDKIILKEGSSIKAGNNGINID